MVLLLQFVDDSTLFELKLVFSKFALLKLIDDIILFIYRVLIFQLIILAVSVEFTQDLLFFINLIKLLLIF